MARIYLLLLTVLLACGSTQQQTDSTTVVASAATAAVPTAFKHLTHPPRTASDSKPPALFIMHGYGSNSQNMDWLPSKLDGRFYCINVQAPIQLNDNGYAWYSLKWHNGQVTDYDRAGAEKVVEDFSAFVQECISSYGLDADRVYCTGFSQGAIMSLDMLLLHPEQTAGAAVMSGRLRDHTTERIIDKDALAGKPILITHGTTDPVIPIDEMRTGKNLLEQYKLNLEWFEYEGGHTVTPATLSKVQQWCTQQLNSKKE